MKYPSIRKEEHKNRVFPNYFWLFGCTNIIGKVVQLILTLDKGYYAFLVIDLDISTVQKYKDALKYSKETIEKLEKVL
jgi:hypothetical protein